MTETLAASPLARATGLALVQFLWQGAIIGAVTAALLIALRRSTAQARYVVGCLGLALMMAAPVVTAAGYLRQTPTGAGGSAAVRPAHPGSMDVLATPSGAGTVAASESRPTGQFRERIERWLPFVVMTWSGGVLLLALQLFRGWLRLRHIRRQAAPLDGSGWPATARLVATRLGITRSVRLVESALVEVPAVIGWLRPIILMPVSALAGLSAGDLEAILAHELAHVRRGDYLVNVVQCVVEVLLFYHPGVWWVSGQIRLEREHCCDDLAASLCGDRVTYARALASLEELRAETPRLAMAATGAPLLGRVRRLVEPGSPSGSRWSGGFVMSVVLTVMLFAASSQIRSMPAGESGATPSISAPVAAPVVRVAEVPVPLAPQPKPAAAPVRAASIVPSVAATPTGEPVVRAIVPVVGQISGEVRDPQGGALPGVTVTVTSVATSDSLTAVTNAPGRFHFDDLAEGAYDLTAQLSGFRTFKTRVQVAPNETVSAGIRLRLGTIKEEITVTVPRPPSAPASPRDVVRSVLRAGQLPLAAADEDQITPIPESVPGAPIRIGGNVRPPRKTRDVKPVYPADAVAANVTGDVVMEAVVDKDGTVKDARVLRGYQLLDAAALDAVRQWQFTPAQLNGVPVEVVMSVTIIFSMK